MLRRPLLAALFIGLISVSAAAQGIPDSVLVVTSCAAQSYTPGRVQPLTMDPTGKLCDSGGGSSSNPSVGSNGTTAPTFSTQIGAQNGGGNLVAVSPTNPLPITTAPTNAAGTYSAATVGTSSGSILAANTAKIYLDVINNSPTATVCINPNGAATISGTACAAGEWTLPPLANKYFAGNFVPSDQLFAIASAASTPVTVGAK